jgi:hypothetical protein
MDLTLAVVRRAEGELIEDTFGEPLGGSLGCVQRVGPAADQLHDFGTMDEAQTVVGDHFRLLVAPPASTAAAGYARIRLRGFLTTA